MCGIGNQYINMVNINFHYSVILSETMEKPRIVGFQKYQNNDTFIKKTYSGPVCNYDVWGTFDDIYYAMT